MVTIEKIAPRGLIMTYNIDADIVPVNSIRPALGVIPPSERAEHNSNPASTGSLSNSG
jgi:hypothetical protein